MFTYIKFSEENHYVTFEKELDPETYEIGTTWEDYLNDKYVLLSPEQITFHEDNPHAEVNEVFAMQFDHPIWYIKKSHKGHFLKLDVELAPRLYNNIGTTWEDFMADMWIYLSDEQVAFMEANPKASAKEVFDMALTPASVRTIEDAKREMLRKIDEYDTSEAVNSFTVNGVLKGWFTPAERTDHKNSIDSAKLMGIETLSFFIGDIKMEIAPEMAEQMLAAIQIYANQCFIVTKEHKLAVEALESIEAVDAYDYTSNYPERLNFVLG